MNHDADRTPPWHSYLFALLATFAIVGIRIALTPLLGPHALFFFLIFAVAISSGYGGLVPGLLSTALGVGIAVAAWPGAHTPAFLDFEVDRLHVILFLAVGVIISVASELTWRRIRQREGALREAGDRLTGTLETINDGFAFLDRDWRFTYANSAAAHLLRARTGELKGQTLWDALPGAADLPLATQLRAALRQNTPAHFEAYYPPFAAWYDCHCYPQSEGTTLILRDITDRKRAEDDLRRNQETLELAQMAGRIGTFDWDLLTGQIRITRELELIYGLPPGQEIWLFRDWEERLHPEDAEAVKDRLSKAVNTCAEFHAEYRIITPAGDVRWIDARGKVFCDTRGRSVRMIGINMDVTERRSLESAMRESEDRLRLAVDSADLGAWDINPVTSELTWSSRCKAIFGLPENAPVSYATFLSRVHPEDRDYVDGVVQCALDPGGDGEFRLEYRVLWPDESVHWVSANGRSYFAVIEKQRRAVRFTGTVRDITERKQAEHAREGHFEQMNRLIETSRRVLAETTPEGLLKQVIDAAAQLTDARLGIAVHEGSGGPRVAACRRMDGALPCRPGDELPREFLSEYRRALQQEAVRWTQQQMHTRPDLQILAERHPEFQGLLTARLVDAAGKPGGLILVSNKEDGDFTAEDEAILRHLAPIASLALQHIEARIRSEAANEAKDRFLAILSHELRTPLTPVVMTASAMEADPTLPTSVREDAALIRSNVQMEVRLIDDLLDLNRIARGKLEWRPRPIDAHAKIERAVEICRPEAENKQLQLAVDLRAAHHHIKGDPGRLEQVCWNLLRNAVKFTPSGGRIEVRSSNPGPQLLRLQFLDNGIGIEPEVLPRLFEAFEQGSRTVTRQFGGLGLGLAISKALVELHGGTIRAASEGRNRGATFTIDLPTVLAETPELTPAADSGSAAPAGMRILVVEDHLVSLTVLSKMLRRLGNEVRTAGNIADARKLLDSEEFQLLISDLGLPDGSGLDLMRDVRARLPHLVGIALSGYGMEEDVQRSKDAGFEEHVTKPVDLNSLNAVLDRMSAKIRQPVGR